MAIAPLLFLSSTRVRLGVHEAEPHVMGSQASCSNRPPAYGGSTAGPDDKWLKCTQVIMGIGPLDYRKEVLVYGEIYPRLLDIKSFSNSPTPSQARTAPRICDERHVMQSYVCLFRDFLTLEPSRHQFHRPAGYGRLPPALNVYRPGGACLQRTHVMPKAIIKKYKGVSRSVNSSQPSKSRYTKALPPKALNMTELAKERERSRQSYIDQLLSVSRSGARVGRITDQPQVSIPVKSVC